MKLAIIAAIAENNVIGKDRDIPWKLKQDMARFKLLTTQVAPEVTEQNPIIMGRITYDSFKKKPLPMRKNIVLTSRPIPEPDVLLVSSLEEALGYCYINHPDNIVYVIGGQKVYEQALPMAEILQLTRVHKAFDGNVYFPHINFSQWKKIHSEEQSEDGLDFTFETYMRK